MDWKKLALCAAMAGTAMTMVACGGENNDMPPVTRRYVMSVIEIPESEGDSAVGFNLDGLVSTGDDDTSCVGLTPDFNSLNDPGETGVDNALAGLVPQLGSLLGDSCPAGTASAECLSALLGQQIAEGSVLIILEVRDINSYANDSDVEMQLYLGTVPGCDTTMPDTCVPELDGATIAPGQDYDVTAVGTPVSGSISGGRLTANTDLLTIAINTMDLALDLNLRQAEVRANITENSLTNGAIGGSLRLQEIADAAEAIMTGLGMTTLSILQGIADMDPQTADPLTCDAMSAGIRFQAVSAQSEMPAM